MRALGLSGSLTIPRCCHLEKGVNSWFPETSTYPSTLSQFLEVLESLPVPEWPMYMTFLMLRFCPTTSRIHLLVLTYFWLKKGFHCVVLALDHALCKARQFSCFLLVWVYDPLLFTRNGASVHSFLSFLK